MCMGVARPKVSSMMRGDFSKLTERKLMDCPTRLGIDIEIKVRMATTKIGDWMRARGLVGTAFHSQRTHGFVSKVAQERRFPSHEQCYHPVSEQQH